jgi:hypothetical protein
VTPAQIGKATWDGAPARQHVLARPLSPFLPRPTRKGYPDDGYHILLHCPAARPTEHSSNAARYAGRHRAPSEYRRPSSAEPVVASPGRDDPTRRLVRQSAAAGHALAARRLRPAWDIYRSQERPLPGATISTELHAGNHSGAWNGAVGGKSLEALEIALRRGSEPRPAVYPFTAPSDSARTI